jgi:hypothetical protein
MFCNVGRSYVALPLLLGFPLSTLPHPPLLFSPLPSSSRSSASRAFRAGCSWTRPLSAVLSTCFDLNGFLYTFRPRTFYAQRQWTWQGFLLVFVLLFSYIILFLLYSYVYCCYIYVLLYFGLFYLTSPPCTQAFPNLIARTFVVAGLSVASVCKSPGV